MKVRAAITAAKQLRPEPNPVIPEPPAYKACVAHLKKMGSKGGRARTEAALETGCEHQYEALRKEALGFLITGDWMTQEAKEQGVKLTDKEVQQSFDQSKKRQYPKEAEFQSFMAITGQTEADYLLPTKVQLLAERVHASIAKQAARRATEATVVEYYKEHELAFEVPETRDVQIVLTKTKAQAVQAEREIQSGKRFRSVAMKDSIDPGVKANGGLLKGVLRGEDEQAFTDAVFAAKIGVLGGPVQTPFGYYVYEVIAVHPPIKKPFARVRAAVREALVYEESQAMVVAAQRKWEALTKCRPEYHVEYCGKTI